ncbi:MAG TPA: CPBP family intramembrane glutamic endopeptidase [Gemmatimonadaceae bacterium]
MFFLLTYAFTWVSWIAAWKISGSGASGYPGTTAGTLIFYLGVFAPSFVALWLTSRREGSAGVRALLSRLVQWRVGFQWYVFAISYSAVIRLTAALIHRLATGAWPPFGQEPLHLMLAATIGSTLLFGQAGEEIGWRGYLLPRLSARVGLATASIVIGIVWAAWHLPLFFIPGIETTGQSFTLYLLQVTAFSVAIAWLYVHTNGSLFLTMLMHSAINNTKDVVPSVARIPANPFTINASLMGWLTAALLWISAAYFLVRMREGLQLSVERSSRTCRAS